MPTAPATPATAPRRETLHKGDDGIAVIWPQDVRPGVLRLGELQRGVEYVVAPAEAIRLVDGKGLQYASAADARRAAAFIEARNRAAAPSAVDPAPPAAATATGGAGGTPVNQQDEE